MDVSDRSLQAKLTQEAKITSASFLSEVIFAFGGFIGAPAPDRAVGGLLHISSMYSRNTPAMKSASGGA